MLRDVSTGTVSPVFAGREPQLGALSDAFTAAAAGAPMVVLLAGEAGVGKSRLAAEFAARLPPHALMLTGGCVQLAGDGLPYAPFAAALRQLIRARGVDQVTALLPGPAADGLAMLLPGFGSPPPDGDAPTARVRLFELLLALLEALADRQPLVLIIEDLHWADRATCDLLSFLIRNLRDAAVLLVCTFRADELDAEHPLALLLPGMQRVAGVRRIDLAPLSRAELAAQLAGMLGQPPTPSIVNPIYERGGGNPLFTEALLTKDGAVRDELPGTLREQLLATVQRLPEETQQLLRTAAVAGTQIAHALLAAVTSTAEDTLSGVLRPAVATHVLVGETDGYAFRHALIREAVLADALPGERTQAHRRFAEALAADASLSPPGPGVAAQIARHWLGARDLEAALRSAWRAADLAGATFGYVEQMQMAEQVLALWEQVPDPTRVTGTDHAGVLTLAADAARRAGQPQRGMQLIEAALSELGESGDPERRARLLRRRAGALQDLLLPGQIDQLHAALALAPADTAARAEILAPLCWALMRESRYQEAASIAEDLRGLAERLADPAYQAEAELAVAALGTYTGHDTAEQLYQATDRAAATGLGSLEAWAFLTLTNVLEALGRHQEGITEGRRGLARARALGLARQLAAPIAGNLAQSLSSVGKWDEALEVVEEILSLDLPPLGRNHALQLRGQLAVARGEMDIASAMLRELAELPAGVRAEPQRLLPLIQLEIDCRLAEGDLTAAQAAVSPVLDLDLDLDATPRYSWPLLVAAMRACAEAIGHARDTDHITALRDGLQVRAAVLGRHSPAERAHAATFAAEAARADRTPDPAGWNVAATAWETAGQPYPLAYALIRAAAATAAAGDRDAAARRLTRADTLATQLRAAPLQQHISQLARRARIPLTPAEGGTPGADTSAPFGLTAREHEVLCLVSAGASNRDIAGALFISPKTASVHVSNILAKLAVSTRGEAAATAHRLHLVDAT